MNTPANVLIKEFVPSLEKPTIKWWVWVVILAVVALFGIFALIMQIVEGQVITGMRDHAVWGIYTANFVFFMGLSYAGALVSCSFQLLRIKWAKPVLRIAELITVSTLIVGAPYILFCLGRLDRIHYLFTHGRIQSPITWDVIAISTDLVFCIAFLYFTHIRDFAKLRDLTDFNVAPWRKKMYKILALGYTGTPAQKKYLHQAHDIMAAIIIPTAIIAYSLLSLLFSMSLKPGWHSTIFSPYFVVTAGYSGVAFLIVMMWIYRQNANAKKYITNLHFNYFAFGLILLALIYAYFTFSEYLTQWYNQTNSMETLLSNLANMDQFGWLSVFHVVFAFIVPIFILGFPWFRTINSVTLVSLFIILALWVKRYLIVVPPLENPFIPIQDIRPEYVNYSVSWVEWALTISGIAIIVLIFTVASKLAPIIPVSDVADADNIEKPKLLFKTKGE